jgi:hypothetical protein
MRTLLPTSQATKVLGVSDRTLRTLRQEGVLRPGEHFAVKGSGTFRPNLIWDVSAVQEALAQRAQDLMA